MEGGESQSSETAHEKRKDEMGEARGKKIGKERDGKSGKGGELSLEREREGGGRIGKGKRTGPRWDGDRRKEGEGRRNCRRVREEEREYVRNAKKRNAKKLYACEGDRNTKVRKCRGRKRDGEKSEKGNSKRERQKK